MNRSLVRTVLDRSKVVVCGCHDTLPYHLFGGGGGGVVVLS